MPPALILPDYADVLERDKATVWVVTGDRSFEPRAVSVGYSDSRSSEVIAGTLKAGERVIVGYRD